MQDLSSALSSGDAIKAAEAFKAAFEICQFEPQYEEQDMGSEDTE